MKLRWEREASVRVGGKGAPVCGGGGGYSPPKFIREELEQELLLAAWL